MSVLVSEGAVFPTVEDNVKVTPTGRVILDANHDLPDLPAGELGRVVPDHGSGYVWISDYSDLGGTARTQTEAAERVLDDYLVQYKVRNR